MLRSSESKNMFGFFVLGLNLVVGPRDAFPEYSSIVLFILHALKLTPGGLQVKVSCLCLQLYMPRGHMYVVFQCTKFCSKWEHKDIKSAIKPKLVNRKNNFGQWRKSFYLKRGAL